VIVVPVKAADEADAATRQPTLQVSPHVSMQILFLPALPCPQGEDVAYVSLTRCGGGDDAAKETMQAKTPSLLHTALRHCATSEDTKPAARGFAPSCNKHCKTTVLDCKKMQGSRG
jgi:hypothetical protein